jgi:putative methionine-R-sulfoxide reductase with GAF domain
MATTGDLTQQLAALADGLGPVLAPTEQRQQLVDLCALVRVATASGSVSVARLDGDELVYEAADGRGATGITGVRLPTTRGVAGYVARTGHSLVVDQVQADPRFARDVAERTGYVPTALLVVPITDANDDVLGVLSVLDRGSGAGDPLVVASSAARVAAPLLASASAVARLGPLLLRAFADAVRDNDDSLATSLRRIADQRIEPDGAGEELPELAALLAEMRTLPPAAQQSVRRIVREAIALAAPRRRR